MSFIDTKLELLGSQRLHSARSYGFLLSMGYCSSYGRDPSFLWCMYPMVCHVSFHGFSRSFHSLCVFSCNLGGWEHGGVSKYGVTPIYRLKC